MDNEIIGENLEESLDIAGVNETHPKKHMFVQLILAGLILVFVVAPSLAFAQDTVPASEKDPVLSENVASVELEPLPDVAPQEIHVVADMSLYYPKAEQRGNGSFDISFDFFNRKGSQLGVKPSVQLYQQTEFGRILIDTYTEDSLVLAVGENETVPVSFTYTPSLLLPGEYDVELRGTGQDGILIAYNKTVPALVQPAPQLRNTKYVLLDDCTLLHPKGTLHELMEYVAVTPEETPELICTAHSTFDTTVTLPVLIETRERSPFGSVVSAVTGNNTPTATVPVGELSTIRIPLPVASKAQQYSTIVTLTDTSGQPVSNDVIVFYVSEGRRATIENAIIDRSVYEPGDTAKVLLFWTSGTGSVYSDTAVGIDGLTMNVKLNNHTGQECANEMLQELIVGKSVIEARLPIEVECINPLVTVSIEDIDGTVLAMQKYDATTPRTMGESVNDVADDENILWYVYFAALLVVLLLVVVHLKRKRDDDTNDTNASDSNNMHKHTVISIMLALSIGFGAFAGMDVNKVNAITVVGDVGSGNTVTWWVHNTLPVYRPYQKISLYSAFTKTGPVSNFPDNSSWFTLPNTGGWSPLMITGDIPFHSLTNSLIDGYDSPGLKTMGYTMRTWYGCFTCGPYLEWKPPLTNELIPVVLDAVCGSSNNGSFSSPPSTNLCSKGSPSGVSTGGGNYTWTCNGVDAGAFEGKDESCIATVIVAPPVCGNGVVESGESCDNGASNGSCPASCSNSCTTNSCVTGTSFSCQGSIGAGGVRWDSEEETDLVNNTTSWVYQSSDTSNKCQYKCRSGYIRSGGQCVLNGTAPVAEITSPPNLTIFPLGNYGVPDKSSITFTGTATDADGDMITQYEWFLGDYYYSGGPRSYSGTGFQARYPNPYGTTPTGYAYKRVAADVSGNITISVAYLDPGLYKIYLKAKDDTGRWSQPVTSLVRVIDPAEICSDDPIFGNTTYIRPECLEEHNTLPVAFIHDLGSNARIIGASRPFQFSGTDADGHWMNFEVEKEDKSSFLTGCQTGTGNYCAPGVKSDQLSWGAWDTPGPYTIRARAFDGWDWGDWTEYILTLTCPVPNVWNGSSCVAATAGSPNPPTVLPVEGTPGDTNSHLSGTAQSFTIQASDPDDQAIWYNIDWDNDGSGDEAAPVAGAAGPVPSNSIEAVSYTWSTPGLKSFQVQAIDVDNKVSGWTSHLITICDSAAEIWDGAACVTTPKPDLVPSIPTASAVSVLAGDSITFDTGVITNTGAADAGPYTIGGFYIDYNGDGVSDYPEETIPAVVTDTVPGGSHSRSAIWNVPLTVTPGTNYRISYIVDDGLAVPESNENNNFSGWSETFTVIKPICTGVPVDATIHPGDDTDLSGDTVATYSSVDNPGTKCEFRCDSGYTWNASQNRCVSGDLSSAGCIVADGDVDCSADLYWTVSNVANGYITEGGLTIESGINSNNSRPVTIGFTPVVYQLYDNGDLLLDSLNLNASCAAGSAWNVVLNICASLPPPPVINISVDQDLIRSGEVADVQVDITANYDLSCQLLNAGTSPIPIDHLADPAIQIYNNSTRPLASTQIVTVVCTNPTFPTMSIDPEEERVEVAPAYQEI